MDGWKISFLLGWLPGRCYVSFRECIIIEVFQNRGRWACATHTHTHIYIYKLPVHFNATIWLTLRQHTKIFCMKWTLTEILPILLYQNKQQNKRKHKTRGRDGLGETRVVLFFSFLVFQSWKKPKIIIKKNISISTGLSHVLFVKSANSVSSASGWENTYFSFHLQISRYKFLLLRDS